MVLDNYCEIEIEGKKRKMCLRNRCVFAAEAELVNGNLLKTVTNMPLSYQDMFALFKWALIGGGAKFSDEDEAFELYAKAVEELGSVVVFGKVYEAIQKSGLLSNGTKKVKAAEKA